MPFFSRHTTGTLLSTIVNDIERVQYAMSTVLAEFLQQFFTFLFVAGVVVVLGRNLSWVLLLFVPVIIYSARKIGSRVRNTTRLGQDKLAEIQNILHETITGNRIVKAFNTESWEISRFRGAIMACFWGNMPVIWPHGTSSSGHEKLPTLGPAFRRAGGEDTRARVRCHRARERTRGPLGTSHALSRPCAEIVPA